MASIYESPGQQVALTGSQTSPSFQPGTAYDPSQMMLRQSEKDLGAFAQFSDTLTKFITDRAKEKNEAEKQLGIADIVNGDMTPSADAYAKYQQDVAVLKTGAEEDTKIGNSISEQGSLAVGQQFKTDSKAVSGWRAYGRVVGKAKLVASSAQGFMAAWMESKDKIIPTRDGRLISPAEVGADPAEIQAMLAMGQQALIQQSGIQGINPMIIAEHVAPTLQAVRGQLFSNKLTSEVAKQKKTAISDLKGELRTVFSNTDLTSDQMFVDYQQFVTNLEVYGDLARGEANDVAIKEVLDTIETMSPVLAREMLEKLSTVRKIAGDPNSITLSSAYAKDFDKTLNAIDEGEEKFNKRQEAAETKSAETAYTIYMQSRLNPNIPPDQLKQSREAVLNMLNEQAKLGNAKAGNLYNKLVTEPVNLDYTLYLKYKEGIAQGQQPTEAQINKDVAEGYLTPNQGEELKGSAAADAQAAFYKQNAKAIEEDVVAGLKERGAVTFNPLNNDPTKFSQQTRQIVNDLTQQAFAWYESQLKAGKTPTDNDINQFTINRLPRVIGQYFEYIPADKTYKPRPISNNPELTPERINSALSGYVPDAAGFNPRTIQLRNLNSGTSRQLTAQEVTQSIGQLKTGQPVSAKVQTLANSTLGGLPALLQQQSVHNNLDPKEVQGLPFVQQNAQYAAVAPWATRRLNATGGNALQQILQLQRIQQAQLRRQRMEASAGMAPVTDLRPGVKIGMREYIQLGLQNGLSKEEAIEMAAVGMAESTGNSGVRNSNPDTGDDSYGLWQINMIGNLGPDRLRRYGLRSAEDLKDPETNARVMAAMLRTDGKTAWGAYKDKRYLQYMAEARRMFAETQGSNFNSARGGRANFSPTNVQSIRIETPGNSFQPGMDLWFADKQFGAVLPGKVKEIRRNNGNYGNMIVVESTDPTTGDIVDVVYAHLDSINVREGDSVRPGIILGKQGGTGRVKSADGTIASIDFLAPASAGSNAMTPYPNWKRLATRIKQQIETNTFR
jgi:murein DD-endopeptidase MepM/ murein hydrolase activator NlpD